MKKTRYEKLKDYLNELNNEIAQLEALENKEIDRMITPDIRAAMELVSSRYQAAREGLKAKLERVELEIFIIEKQQEE